MATKAELGVAISELLGEPINVDDFKHDELVDMLQDLKRDEAEAEAETGDEAEAETGDEAEAETGDDEAGADVGLVNTVAAGKAITTKRGILSGGAVITRDDVASFDRLVAAGYIV